MSQTLIPTWPVGPLSSLECTGSEPADRHLPRVLLITHRTPYPPDKGDRIRSYHVLRYLSRRARVDLATLSDEPVDHETQQALCELAGTVEIVPIEPRRRWVQATASLIRGRSATQGLFASRELRRRLQRMTARNHYDLVIVVCSGMVQFLDGLELGKAKILVDLIDVDSEKWFDYAASASGWRRRAYGLEGRRVRRLEVLLAGKCDRIAVVSSAERECLLAFHPTAHVTAIPNGVDFDFFRPDDASICAPNSCVFVGALDYKPNVDGIQWFCDAVWPEVVRVRPNASFTIVGRRPVEAVRQLDGRPGVSVVANVADVRPYLWSAAVTVAPLRIARGVQNKVLEAMASGKPVLVSPEALTGLAARDDEEVRVARSAEQWQTSLQQLFDDDALRRRLGMAARRYVTRQHHWDECLHPIANLLTNGAALSR